MKIILETERLTLREFCSDDALSCFQLNSNQNVLRYTGDIPFKSELEAKEFILNYKDYSKNGFGRWAVILKDTNQFIGWCGLKLHDDGMVDLGYRFFEKDWNNGYATEAATACIEYGFNELNIKTIVGRSAIENKASIGVLLKLKMKFWKNDTCNGIEKAAFYKISKLKIQE